ncbi:MAG: RNA methyltransferase, partial [Deltaproteobacteria bacterium]|nr:RNA methyltransferase [Nannocystaceae bacterium]
RAELVVASATAAARLDALALGDAVTLQLDETEISRVVGFEFHRGCIAVLPRPRGGDAQLVARMAARPNRVLALDRVVDPANVGAIVRSARAFATDLVLVGRGCGDPWSRRAVRASMGAVLEQPLLDDIDLVAALAHDPQLCWWAADAGGDARALDQLTIPPRLGIVLGNEGQGISPALRERAAVSVRIPIAAAVDSLNVAAAAAILLWHARLHGAMQTSTNS